MTKEDLDKMGLEEIPGQSGKYRKKAKQPEIVTVPVGKTITVEWQGKHISLNEWYESKHWANRNKHAKEWHAFFKRLLLAKGKIETVDKYRIALHYNSNLDPSNTITIIKLFEDTMQDIGMVKNDNKKFCVGIYIFPKENMPAKSYKIIVQSA